jgi:DNA-binding HxlR family transcriptional regulator
MVEHAEITAFCPNYHHAVELLGRRWSGAILRAMIAGATRFTEIGAAIPGLSDRLLSERLKEFEAERLVERRVEPSTPVRIEYRLTAKGRELAPVVEALSAWAERWAEVDDGCAAADAMAATSSQLRSR